MDFRRGVMKITEGFIVKLSKHIGKELTISVDVSTDEENGFNRAYGEGYLGLQVDNDYQITLLFEGNTNF